MSALSPDLVRQHPGGLSLAPRCHTAWLALQGRQQLVHLHNRRHAILDCVVRVVNQHSELLSFETNKMEGRILLELKVPFGAASTKRQALRFLRSFVPLFASSIALLVLSVFVIYYHAANLVWIAKHDAPDLKHATGFELQFSGQIHKVTWLPTHLHKGPQYQLAVAAAATCLLAGIDIAVIYITARRVKQVSYPYPFLSEALFMSSRWLRDYLKTCLIRSSLLSVVLDTIYLPLLSFLLWSSPSQP